MISLVIYLEDVDKLSMFFFTLWQTLHSDSRHSFHIYCLVSFYWPFSQWVSLFTTVVGTQSNTPKDHLLSWKQLYNKFCKWYYFVFFIYIYMWINFIWCWPSKSCCCSFKWTRKYGSWMSVMLNAQMIFHWRK